MKPRLGQLSSETTGAPLPAAGGRAAALRRASRVALLALFVGGGSLPAQTDRPLGAALDSVARVAGRISRPDDAASAGYHRIAPRGLSDLNPLVGEHWINEQWNRGRSLDLARPAYLMFYPGLGVEPMTLVGVGYTVAQPAGAGAPIGFSGTEDRWHVHLPCAGVPDLQGILAESAAECAEVGGTPAEWQIAMVHVWLVPNPDGPFGQFNPALPFVATGIAPPTAAELADPARGPLLRALGLALGETFGAVPRLGGTIAQHPDSAFADQARPHRARIAALVGDLREARATSDTAAQRDIGTRMTDAWYAIRDAYLEHARSPRLRLLLERWFAAALTGHHTTQLSPIHRH